MSRSQTNIHGTSIVAGFQADASEVRFHAFHPLTKKASNESYFAATPKDVDRAARQAAEAFPSLREDTGCRAAMLDAVAAGLADLGQSLIDAACEETGLPVARITMERDRTVRQLRMFAEIVRDGTWVEAVINRGDPNRAPLPKPDIRRMLRPLGPVAVFGASNFPLAYSVAGGDTTSALASGCPVVVKGHSAHPKTGELTAETIRRAVEDVGLHPGSFSFLQAGGIRDVAVGVELLSHPCIKAGGFTGSVKAGMALNRLAQDRNPPVPFFAEMGSVNPVVVLPKMLNSRAQEIASKLAQSAFASNGQMCTCPGLMFVIRGDAAEAFKERLRAEAAAISTMTLLTPRIEQAWHEGVRAAIECGARSLTESAGGVLPTVLVVGARQFMSNPSLAEETFGPSTIIVECEDVHELRASLSVIAGSLTATLWCESDEREAATVFESLEAMSGRIVVNAVPTGVEVCDAMVHSGPYPASNRPDSTAVGSFAIRRWCRPVAYQNVPQSLMPLALQDENELGILRLVEGEWEV